MSIILLIIAIVFIITGHLLYEQCQEDIVEAEKLRKEYVSFLEAIDKYVEDNPKKSRRKKYEKTIDKIVKQNIKRKGKKK